VKKLLIAALAGLCMTGFELYSQTGKDSIAKIQDAAQNNVRLLLPQALYAVPGTELNVYFDNIVLVPDIKRMQFDVDCKYGRQDQTRWRFTPEAKDAGSFPLTIKVYDAASKLLAEATATVYVSPKDSGKGRQISVMLLGASQTAASIYPQELYDLFKKDEGLNVKFVGTNSSSGFPVKEGIAAHEGRGGWGWARYCTQFEDPKEPRPIFKSSPFLFKKDDKVVLDFKNYCDKNNNGKAPDYITILLGINDVFSFDDVQFEQNLPAIFASADTLINEFRKMSPDTKIGIALVPPPAASQDAFGKNYKCGQTRWQYRKNQHRYVESLIKKFGGREKENLFIIPLHVNIDCENNYPKEEVQVNARNPKKVLIASNGCHPTKEGYLQFADSFYSWIKFELNKK